MRIRNTFRQVVMFASLAIVTSGCASTGIRHISAQEFVSHARSVEIINSAPLRVTYLGSTSERAYLEYWGFRVTWRIFEPMTMIYWTELDGLPPHLVSQLRAGKVPWIPWEGRLSKPEKE